jgi:hypothetical protein
MFGIKIKAVGTREYETIRNVELVPVLASIHGGRVPKIGRSVVLDPRPRRQGCYSQPPWCRVLLGMRCELGEEREKGSRDSVEGVRCGGLAAACRAKKGGHGSGRSVAWLWRQRLTTAWRKQGGSVEDLQRRWRQQRARRGHQSSGGRRPLRRIVHHQSNFRCRRIKHRRGTSPLLVVTYI